ncbi:hypothetical protein, partial [Turicimonas muris]|uniref:hypothetical protein n=1 Tax=Turicimonas muris TaxID=1796652 RepID=UPI0025A60F63
KIKASIWQGRYKEAILSSFTNRQKINRLDNSKTRIRPLMNSKHNLAGKVGLEVLRAFPPHP